MQEGRILSLFVEGETEYHFYKKLLFHYSLNNGKHICQKIFIKKAKGIGNFQKKVPKKFKTEILDKFPNSTHSVFLAYDTDVFDFNINPPINWSSIEKSIRELGVKYIFHLKAEKSIEDFFLEDVDGLCEYLGISSQKVPKGKDSVKKIKLLFDKGSKIYQKGYTYKFLEKLDFAKILNKRSNVFWKLRLGLYDFEFPKERK